jgi:hypothetical protein
MYFILIKQNESCFLKLPFLDEEVDLSFHEYISNNMPNNIEELSINVGYEYEEDDHKDNNVNLQKSLFTNFPSSLKKFIINVEDYYYNKNSTNIFLNHIKMPFDSKIMINFFNNHCNTIYFINKINLPSGLNNINFSSVNEIQLSDNCIKYLTSNNINYSFHKSNNDVDTYLFYKMLQFK